MHQQFLGGGYGRRIAPDIAIQATILSSIVKKPVKLLLTREDDIWAARPRPMTHHVLKAGIDHGNNLIGWYHRLVAENVSALAAPPSYEGSGGDDLIGWRGLDQAYYDIPHALAEGVRANNGMRVWPWRGIGAGYNKFAAECFLDEVAAAMGKDPLALRLELTKDHARANAVIKAAAEMSDFAKKRPGRGLGIAFSDYHGTFTAGVVEVSLDQQTGKIKVHNVWMAVDPGIVLQPKHVHAQLESGIAFGLSAALLEELPFKDGSFDCVVSTWTLCSIPEVGRALGEVYRVLQPGGRFIFLEHGLSMEPKVQRWQRRLNPLQRFLGDGCRLDLDVPAIVGVQPFADIKFDRFAMERVPRTHGTMYRGVATR